MIAQVPPKHAVDIARILALVRDQKLVSETEFKRLHAALRINGPPAPGDPGSRPLWTVGLKSLSWSRLEGGQWVPAGPPGDFDLELDSGLLKEIASGSPDPGAGLISVAPDGPWPKETKPRISVEQAQKHAEPKDQLTVILTGYGRQKISVVMAVRELTGLGLSEAKALVERLPQAIKRNVSRAQADEIRRTILGAGGAVEIARNN
jgi:ribosomal protein L7/L12